MLRTIGIVLGLTGSIIAGSAGPPANAQEAATPGDWATYRNERFGFTLKYPTLFQVERTSEAGDGRVFAARDGAARLLVGALFNTDQHSTKSYQDYIAKKSYADYEVTYRKLGQSWLVLSGEGKGKIFYEKAMFSCAGRVINSFALIYPAEQRATFDPIVERIEDTFQPGTAQCKDNRSAQGRRPTERARSSQNREPRPYRTYSRSRMADRIARERGTDVIVIMRRTSPPYDYRYVRGYVER